MLINYLSDIWSRKGVYSKNCSCTVILQHNIEMERFSRWQPCWSERRLSKLKAESLITHKQLESMGVCTQHCGYWYPGTNQVISIHSADHINGLVQGCSNSIDIAVLHKAINICIALEQFQTKISPLLQITLENKIEFREKKMTQLFKG